MNFTDAVFERSAYTPEQLPASSLPEIVFSGRSNVGKSSVINKLTNHKALARVSSAPGKTASINFYNCGGRLRLVDLPGYGYARAARGEKQRWSALVEGYFAGGRNIRLVVQLIDVRHAPSEDDLHMLYYLQSQNIPFIAALTKCDKLNKTELLERKAVIPQQTGVNENMLIYFSSHTGEGLKELKTHIEAALR